MSGFSLGLAAILAWFARLFLWVDKGVAWIFITLALAAIPKSQYYTRGLGNARLTPNLHGLIHSALISYLTRDPVISLFLPSLLFCTFYVFPQ